MCVCVCVCVSVCVMNGCVCDGCSDSRGVCVMDVCVYLCDGCVCVWDVVTVEVSL